MKRVSFLLILVIAFSLTGCATYTVEEITQDDSYVGETVRVPGTVTTSLKIDGISGYSLLDENGDAILVSTQDLPAEGKQVTTKGVLKKGPLDLGFYIDSQE